MIEHVGPEFPLTETAVRQRQEQLLRMANFKPEVAVNT